MKKRIIFINTKFIQVLRAFCTSGSLRETPTASFRKMSPNNKILGAFCPSASLREISIILSILTLFSSCHIYSLTGASIEGKTINVHQLNNQASIVVPTLSATLTQKIRQRILSQSSLAQVNTDQADYVIEGIITNYDVSVASISGTSTTDKSRLTITVQIDFKNNKNEKGHFSQSFSRFADFNASQSLQSVETTLINSIADQLADDIFNKAFVNW